MAERAVLGDGPIQFTNRNGRQLLIPLTALYFDARGALKLDHWAPYAGLDAVDQGSLQELLKDLVRQRLLTPAKAPAPQAALVFQATLSGAAGNAVTLTVAKVVPDPAKPPDPKNATFDLSVKESAVYPQLSVDAAADNFVADVLGTDADLVSPDGLVHLKAPVADPLPLPKGGTYQLGAGGTQTVAVPQAAAANQTAFTLEARDTDVTAPLTKVVIADVDTTNKSFSLTVARSLGPKNVQLGNLLNNDQGFEYVVDVSQPGGGPAVPAEGTFALAGGTDAASAVNARATILGT